MLDPRRASGLHASARYILRKQLEEADVILINKIDLLSAAGIADLRARVGEGFPGIPVHAVSALAGTGVEAWLSEVLAGPEGGQRIAEVDYDVYAEGEAVLGWLNAAAALEADGAAEWDRACRDLLGRLSDELGRRSAEIAHLKVLLSSPSGLCMANVASSGSPPSVQGTMGRPSRSVRMVLNVRAEMPPDGLRSLVEARLAELPAEGIAVTVERLDCFSPGRPRPTHRYSRIIRA